MRRTDNRNENNGVATNYLPDVSVKVEGKRVEREDFVHVIDAINSYHA